MIISKALKDNSKLPCISYFSTKEKKALKYTPW